MREDVLQKLLSIKEEKNLCISCVLAQSLNGVIGIGGDLPWSEPEDLRFFAKVTKESWLIMGRKTWNSFERSLPRGGSSQRSSSQRSSSWEKLDHPFR